MALSDEDVLEGVKQILHEAAGVPVARVRLEKTFAADLEVDSLSMYEVAMMTQERFGVDMPDEDMKSLRTVADLVAYIQRSGVSA
ncbi:acyl carrier protein [Phytohabitans suffuscus]|uniref:Acyl carrier protein n=1 Tax=Phytohabitans suffuscus TaxID=624315 RepID=A0A6F8YAT0_9ACTN|nr:acyl carrier protein [Phytohabitans suffuscus]BCB83206.1 meromycolate extension acyl carrier protein [Phytohabitans suffuscus]